MAHKEVTKEASEKYSDGLSIDKNTIKSILGVLLGVLVLVGVLTQVVPAGEYVVDDNGHPLLQHITGKFWANNHAHILKGKAGFNEDSLYLFLAKSWIWSHSKSILAKNVEQGSQGQKHQGPSR